MHNIRIVFADSIPWYLVILIFAGMLIFIFVSFKKARPFLKRKSLILFVILRAAALFILLLCIAKPVISYEVRGRTKSKVIVMVDTSKSMKLADSLGGLARIDVAKKLLLDKENGLMNMIKENFPIRIYKFDEDTFEVKRDDFNEKMKALGELTDINKSLKSALKDVGNSAVGIVLLSDGIDNGASDADPSILAPVYAIGIGSKLEKDHKFKDLVLKKINVSETVFKNNVVDVDAEIEARGYDSNKGVKVELLRENKVIAQDSIVVEKEKTPQRITLKFTPKELGVFTYELKIKPEFDEKIIENNTQTFSVRVVDAKIKVLYVEGALRWEYKFLKEVLEQDQNISPSFLVRLKGAEFCQQGRSEVDLSKGFPKDIKELSKFNVIILGDVPRDCFSQEDLENMERFVSKEGGGLIILGGTLLDSPEYKNTPIEEIMPVFIEGRGDSRDLGPFKFELTPEGKSHSIFNGCIDFFSSEAGILERVSIVSEPKPAATVLATVPSKYYKKSPIVFAVERCGEGRTFVCGAKSTWKWYFKQKHKGMESVYRKLWGQAIRWLVGRKERLSEKEGERLTVWSNKRNFNIGETVYLGAEMCEKRGVSLEDCDVEALIIDKNNNTKRLQYQRDTEKTRVYKALFKPKISGKYKISVKMKEQSGKIHAKDLSIIVRAKAQEFEEVDLNEEFLKKIATESSGEYFTVLDAKKIPEKLIERRKEISRFLEIRLWNTPIFFAIFVVLLSIEWIIRRRKIM